MNELLEPNSPTEITSTAAETAVVKQEKHAAELESKAAKIKQYEQHRETKSQAKQVIETIKSRPVSGPQL